MKYFPYAYKDWVVRPDIQMLTINRHEYHPKEMIMWVQHGNFRSKPDDIKLYFLDFWYCYPRTPKCQFIFLTDDYWVDSLDLNDVQFKQIVEDKLQEYNLELIKYLEKK